jgi:hypothetical protein
MIGAHFGTNAKPWPHRLTAMVKGNFKPLPLLWAALTAAAVMIVGYTVMTAYGPNSNWWFAILFVGVFCSPAIIPGAMAFYGLVDLVAGRWMKLGVGTRIWIEATAALVLPFAVMFMPWLMQSYRFSPQFVRGNPWILEAVGGFLVGAAPIMLGLWAGTIVRLLAREPAPPQPVAF